MLMGNTGRISEHDVREELLKHIDDIDKGDTPIEGGVDPLIGLLVSNIRNRRELC